jgi:hypothetical protein
MTQLDHSLCRYSSGICGSITAGQGDLSFDGYWEIPCPECADAANENYQKGYYRA